jgi:hypothetical protein
MKRTLTAVLTSVGLLAGGVTMASPAMAFEDTIAISAVNPGGRELQINALVWCVDNQYAKFAQTPLDPGTNRGMDPHNCDVAWSERAYPNIALGTPEMFAANKQIICNFIITSSRDIQFTVVPLLEAFAYKDLGNNAVLCHAGEKDAKNYATLDQPANSTYNMIVTSAKADGSGYVWDDYYATLNAASTSSVAVAADVEVGAALGASPDDAQDDDTGTDDTNTDDASSDDANSDDTSGDDTSTDDANTDDASSDDGTSDDASDDTGTDDADTGGVDALADSNDPVVRSRVLNDTHQVVKHHHTRVEKMATKVHNRGGILTVHAYGPDKDLALARARAVRIHLEDHLAKRGHTESSPIWVTYAGDPDHKKDTHVTIHWHPDTSLPGEQVPSTVSAG